MICLPGLACATSPIIRLPVPPSHHTREHGHLPSIMYRFAGTLRNIGRSLQGKTHRQRVDNEHDHRDRNDSVISLPLPTFPPPLDFDPESITLPPPYEEVIDVEKAVQYPRKALSSNGSTISTPTTSSYISLSQPQTTQELSIHQPREWVRIVRFLRCIIFTVYRRLFTFVVLVNSVGIYTLVRQVQSPRQAININTLANLASSNLLLAVLIRQNYVINILYRSAWLVPWSVPLAIRRMIARVYSFGGIHSGAAVAGTIWWAAFTASLTWKSCRRDIWTPSALVLTWMAMLLLIAITILAFPNLRARYHNTFEITHRLLGWASIGLFWAQLLCLTHQTCQDSQPPVALGTQLSNTPTFWNLLLITAILMYPWLRIQRWTFIAHPVSSHAIRLSSPNKVHKFSVLSLSSSPLREWHPFATFRSSDLKDVFSVVISGAGDWTQNVIATAHQVQQESSRFSFKSSSTQISHVSDTKTSYASDDRNSHDSDGKTSHGSDDKNLYVSDDKTSYDCEDKIPPQEKDKTQGVPMRFWVRSHPTPGVLSLTLLFPSVLLLTTGSGIGPCLSSLLDRRAHQHVRLVWSTRSPQPTYGQHIMDLVKRADPDALIIDTTDRKDRPDLLEVGWDLWKEGGFEAVFVLSNQKATSEIVEGLEMRGVPAFGPIWDS